MNQTIKLLSHILERIRSLDKKAKQIIYETTKDAFPVILGLFRVYFDFPGKFALPFRLSLTPFPLFRCLTIFHCRKHRNLERNSPVPSEIVCRPSHSNWHLFCAANHLVNSSFHFPVQETWPNPFRAPKQIIHAGIMGRSNKKDICEQKGQRNRSCEVFP